MRLFAVLACLFCCSVLAADDSGNVPRKAKDEVLRRGSMVERPGVVESVGMLAEAVAPPVDDSNKWHLTLVTMQGCVHCEQLRADLAKSEVLKPWVDVDDYKRSWFHFQTVRIEDKSQDWRWLKGKPEALPTLVIQPPVDGSYGPRGAVVDVITGYNGKPAELAAKFRKAVGDHIAKFPRQAADTGIGQWTPPPFLPPLPGPNLPPSPVVPAPVAPVAPMPVAPLPDSMNGWMLIILTISNVIMAWLEYRKNNKPKPA